MNEIQQLNQRIEYLEGVIHKLVLSDRQLVSKDMQFNDGRNIKFGTTTGTKIGTATTHKIAFYGVTPVIQQTRPTNAATIITAGTALGIWA
jgi:hypothetical protein